LIGILRQQFEYLLQHMDSCFPQRPGGGHQDHAGNQDSTCTGTRATARFCCLDACSSLIQLFDTVGDTFSNQLLVEFVLIVGSLTFGVYLSITFIVVQTR
jgi:hypothetical protein